MAHDLKNKEQVLSNLEGTHMCLLVMINTPRDIEVFLEKQSLSHQQETLLSWKTYRDHTMDRMLY